MWYNWHDKYNRYPNKSIAPNRAKMQIRDEKTGRYIAGKERVCRVISATVTENEREEIIKKAAVANLNLSEFIRMAVIAWMNKK
jgi:hypothetical protein